jgi:hypothetical protein
VDDVRLSRDLTEQGYAYGELVRLSRSGDLQRIRRGAYFTGEVKPTEPREVHRQLVLATVRQSSPEAVVSHMSAAALHGLPIWTDALSRVHLTRDRPSSGKRRRYVHLHVGRLESDEVTDVAGLRVTTTARTVADLGRSLAFVRSVAIADAALAGALTRLDLELAVNRDAGRTGVGAARRMCAFADGRSESVGESTSRAVFFQVGLQAPSLQYEVFDDRRQLVGRTDFCWEDQRTLGEFDGKIKYGRLLGPGQSASDVVYAEKLREDRLRDLGWQMVRWTWDDLARPRTLADRLERAFDRGRRGR